MSVETCPVTTHGVNGELRCTEPVGHDKAHSHYRDGQWIATWLTPQEAAEARARGEFGDDWCRCQAPIPVCDECGGDIL